MFIALEGIDGCGKTTVAGRLAERGYTTTEEPFLQCLKEVIVKTTDPEARELAFYFDRIYHLEKFIEPNLKRGDVVTDRYKYSQIAYAYARYRDLDIYDTVLKLNEKIPEGDIVIFLDIAPDIAIRRKPHSDIKSFLKENETPAEFLAAVRKKYLEMADDRWRVINAERPQKEVFEEVLKSL
ncbi:MAG: dTMP kinase [Candidatus Hydrothermarchaeaceae archaeon]